MGGLFSKSKKVSAPPLPDPPPTPDEEAGKFEKKRRHRGRGKTRITGELEPETTKRTLLG